MHKFFLFLIFIGVFQISSSYTIASTCDITVKVGQSIQADGVDKAVSGNIICVEAGTYHEVVNVNKPGVTLKGEGVGRTIIDGQMTLPTGTNSSGDPPYAPLILVSADHVTVTDIEVRNSRGIGIRLLASNGQLNNCKADHTQRQALSLLGDNNSSDNCTALRGNDNFIDGYPRGGNFQAKGENLTITNCIVAYGHKDPLVVTRSKNVTISGCTSYDNHFGGIYVESVDTVLIENNIVFRTDSSDNNRPGINLGQETYPKLSNEIITRNITIQNNLVVNRDIGIQLSIGFDVDDGVKIAIPWAGFRNLIISHNTLINNKTGILFRAHKDNTKNHTPSRVVNNLIYGSTDPMKSSPTGGATDQEVVSQFTFSNNLFHQHLNPPVNIFLSQNESDVFANPKLYNPNQSLPNPQSFDLNNYLLTSTSHAIDVGKKFTNNPVSTDILNNHRPYGHAPDIGFHEYSGKLGPTNTPHPTSPPDQWDLNSDGSVNIYDFSWLSNAFGSDYSFPDLNSFITSL